MIVQIYSYPAESLNVPRHFHITMPTQEFLARPLYAPGEIIARDAAIAFSPFPVYAFVSHADIDPFSVDFHFPVAPKHVKTLGAQHLPPVFKPLGVLGVGV